VKPQLIEFVDSECQYDTAPVNLGADDYENFLKKGDSNYQWLMPEDEWDAISVGIPQGQQAIPRVSSLITAGRTC
jgi:fatty-acyl-CoA synthase